MSYEISFLISRSFYIRSIAKSIVFLYICRIFSIIVELSVRTSAFRAAKKAVPPGSSPSKDSLLVCFQF